MYKRCMLQEEELTSEGHRHSTVVTKSAADVVTVHRQVRSRLCSPRTFTARGFHKQSRLTHSGLWVTEVVTRSWG